MYEFAALIALGLTVVLAELVAQRRLSRWLHDEE